MTTIACRELAPVLGELSDNHEQILTALADASAQGAQVIVLPELATSGYLFESTDEARSCALAPSDPRIAQWSSALAEDAVAVIGFAEQASDGILYNSAALVDHHGLLAVYRKTHLWDREKLWFTPGDAPAPVVETQHGRIAVMVCYDLEFPEYTRQAALAGADLITASVNWPLVERPEGERPPEMHIAQAASRVNCVAFAICDRSGVERGQAWTQGSVIIDHLGWLTGPWGGDQLADLDLLAGRSKRFTERADLFTDRRTDLY